MHIVSNCKRDRVTFMFTTRICLLVTAYPRRKQRNTIKRLAKLDLKKKDY